MKKDKDPFEKFRSHEIHLIDPLDKQMRRIEYETSDTLRLLSDTGAPEYFSTKELIQLKEKVQDELRLFKMWQQRSIALGVGSAICFAALIVFGFLKLIWVAVVAAALCVGCFAGFYMGVALMKKRFESRGELDYVGRLISEELRKRKYGKFNIE
jgi:hypothetical protein